VKVRIDANGTLVGVFFSAHTWGTWYPASAKGQPGGFQCNAKGGPLVYVACQSHSCFAQPGQTVVESTKVLVPEVLALSIVEQTGAGRWSQSATTEIDALKWLEYKGTWGPKGSERISREALQPAIAGAIEAAPWLAALLLAPGLGLTLAGIALATAEAFGPFLYDAQVNGAATPKNQVQWKGDLIMPLAGQYYILRYNDRSLALGIMPATAASPALLAQQRFAQNDPTQKWQLSVAFSNSSYCGVVLTNIQTKLSARWYSDGSIQLQQYLGDPSFTWQLDCLSSNCWAINKDFDGHVMDVAGNSSEPNTRVIVYDWRNQANQMFSFLPCT
jgi:hypothetical protein